MLQSSTKFSVEENLKVLEDLIVEHRMQYDYGFYKIPMDVDYNVLILSKKESRFFKVRSFLKNYVYSMLSSSFSAYILIFAKKCLK